MEEFRYDRTHNPALTPEDAAWRAVTAIERLGGEEFTAEAEDKMEQQDGLLYEELPYFMQRFTAAETSTADQINAGRAFWDGACTAYFVYCGIDPSTSPGRLASFLGESQPAALDFRTLRTLPLPDLQAAVEAALATPANRQLARVTELAHYFYDPADVQEANPEAALLADFDMLAHHFRMGAGCVALVADHKRRLDGGAPSAN